MNKAKILVVEDEYLTRVDIKNSLNAMGYEVIGVADTGDTAIRMTEQLKPDLILMDITLKGKMNGIEAAGEIHENFQIPVVYLTAHSDDATVEKAVITQPFGYLIKPFDERALNTTIQMALFKNEMDEKLRRSERTNRSLLDAIPDALMLVEQNNNIVAVNEKMIQNFGMVRKDFDGLSITDLIANGSLSTSFQVFEDIFTTMKPVILLNQADGKWTETTLYPVTDSRGVVDMVAIQSYDITKWKQLEDQLKQEGISQIERNMEQFQILNDQIRNPLQIIQGYVSLGNCQFKSNIEGQIQIIDNLVTRLDCGWIESEKVRSFLSRHCQHGSETRSASEPDKSSD
jgi:PAS domain S-box-containing protein